MALVYTGGATGGGGGGVASVTAGDTSIVVGGTAANPTVETATLDVIAADHPPAADWSNNSKKVTAVADPTNAQDAATKHYADTKVASVAATDTSIVVGGTATAPTIATATLDVIAADHAPAADWSNNSKKITNLANGAAASDAAAFGQLPTLATLFSGCRVTNTTNTTLTTNTETTLAWDTESWDTDAYHSTVTNTSRLTAPATGTYAVWGAIGFASGSTTGDRYIAFRVNGGADFVFSLYGSPKSATHGAAVPLYVQLQLTAGDYVELRAYQDSGGNLATTASISYFGIQRLA